jgi:hypothetical protein
MKHGVQNLVFLAVLAVIGTGPTGCTESDESLPANDPGGGHIVEVVPPTYPVNGRIAFADRQWTVRSSGDTLQGPGPNHFSDSGDNVWVDGQGLHLRITHRDGMWRCAELIGDGTYGYGTYRFYMNSRLDLYDENVVVGLFTWDDGPEYDHREIDIEMARWGGADGLNAQLTVQPYYLEGNMERYALTTTNTNVTLSFDWYRDRVIFQAVQGHFTNPPPENILKEWTCATPSVFPPGNEALRLNIWLFGGRQPSDGLETEVVIRNVEFIPHGPWAQPLSPHSPLPATRRSG